MKKNGFVVRWGFAFMVVASIGIMFGMGMYRVDVTSDILNSLPEGDRIISDAGYIFKNHPMQDQVAIDIGCSVENADLLVDAGNFLQVELLKSGLFKELGMKQAENLFPELILHITENLPILFTAQDLEDNVIPLINSENVKNVLDDNFSQLFNIQGIGQTDLIIKDPLSLRNIILSRLSHLAPSGNAKIYRNSLVSLDGKHLLVIATPAGSGTDTVFARNLTALIESAGAKIARKFNKGDTKITLTPVGAYRAALDNEETAKSDTQLALLLSTIGVALLLIFAFPRPFIGLLSLVPAFAGSLTAYFVYSLFYKTISILTIGFGGAIIGITVDQGITYLLFFDQEKGSSGSETAREVWGIDIMATLPNMGAFLALYASGFPILEQLGLFASLGILFSFLFVHYAFPRIFPVMPPAKKKRALPLQAFINKIALIGPGYKLSGALLLFSIMLFFARPDFHIDLNAMNTVSKETIAAEKSVTDVWGNVFNRIYIMIEAPHPDDLIKAGDGIARMLEEDVQKKILKSAFVPAMIFPGPERSRENLAAWKKFWNTRRIQTLRTSIRSSSVKYGIAPGAFEPFFNMITKQGIAENTLAKKYYGLLGITKKREGNWMLISTLVPGAQYHAEKYFERYSSIKSIKMFDPNYFSKRFGLLLSKVFKKMMLIVAISIIAILFMFFMDWQLTLVSLLPIAFAFVCTLGTLKIFGHPLDIPALMLSIVVLGVGIDYSMFLTCSYQRYGNEQHPSLGLIRLATSLTSGSTLIGFGTLMFADHSLLRSAGLTCFLGIGYSLIGAYSILPPILNRMFKPSKFSIVQWEPDSPEHRKQFLERWKHFEAFPRIFARFKMYFDPMFKELHSIVEKPVRILDIGTGYGIPAVWLLEHFPGSRVIGIEPDPERARIANKVIGERGSVFIAAAPDLPHIEDKIDTALMLDILHYLDDDSLKVTLKKIHAILDHSGLVCIRATVPTGERMPFLRWVELIKSIIARKKIFYRPETQLDALCAGEQFEITKKFPSGKGREEVWYILKKISKKTRKNNG